MMNMKRLLLVAVVLCSVPGGFFRNEVCFTGCKFREEGEFICKWSNLTSVPDNLPGNVTVLTLFFNSLPALRNKELLNKGCANIVRLHLPWNNIALLEDEAFSGLADLRVVTLDHNHIAAFNKDIFRDNLKLQELYLGANPLTLPSSDTVSLVNSASLTSLSFFYCNSTGLSTGWFSETPNLTQLYVGLDTWVTLELLPENYPEFLAGTELRNNSGYHVECSPDTVLSLTELGDESGDPVNAKDSWDGTVTCDCCLSLANYALEKQARVFCRDSISEADLNLAVPQDLMHLRRCYAAFKGFKATHSDRH